MKRFFSLICCALVCVLLALTGCESKETVFRFDDTADVTIEFSGYGFPPYTGRLQVGNTAGLSLYDLQIVCDDDSVETSFAGTFSADAFRFTVKPKYNGSFEIYIRTKDGSLQTQTRKFIAVGGLEKPTTEKTNP